MKEIWKPIPGYEGLYEVSSLGRVKSLRSNRLMVLSPNSRKYLGLNLYKDGKKKSVHVHRLVAEVFCERPKGKDIVDHINGDKNDNRAQNLRWVTQKENIYFGRRVKPVIRSDGKLYESVRATTADGFHFTSVCACCRGKQEAHRGYTWRYADESVQAVGA